MRIKSALIAAGVIGFFAGLAPQRTYAGGPPVNPTLVQFTSTTVTVTWGLSGATSGYVVEVSTRSDLSVIYGSSATLGTTLSTLTVSGLSPSTTFYAHVGAMNISSTSYAITTPASFVTDPTNVPTGLSATNVGVTSITWSWTAVPGATGYNVYMATSTATLIAGPVGSPSYTETNLSTNTAYGRVVTSIVSAVESGLSGPATGYTLAAIPGGPSFTNVGDSSATVTWSAQGNPSSTIYELSRASVSNFSAGVVTVIPFASNFTGTTTTFITLTPATTYYFRVQAKNGLGALTSFSPVGSVTTTGTLVTGGSGTGTGSVVPGNVAEASVVTTTVTFTVPSGGLSTNGRLEIDLPSGWGPPSQTGNASQPGYVSVLTGGAFTVAPSSQGVVFILSSGFLSGGTTIQIAFQNFYSNCPAAALPQAQWRIKSAMTGSDALADLVSGVNTQGYVTGPFQAVNFVPWSVVTTALNQPTPALLLQASDGCGQPVLLAAPLTITWAGLQSNQSTADLAAQFSNLSNFATTTSTSIIPSSSSTTIIYYQASTVGNNRWIQGTYTHPVYGTGFQVWRQVNVLSQAFAFNNVAVDNGTPVNGQASMTLSPDTDGVNDYAYIRFSPNDANTVWHVAVSSDGFHYNVFERWGSGNPSSSLVWDGRDVHTGFVVPTTSYTVKLEDVNGTVSSTPLVINVNTAQISGHVSLGGISIAGAMVNANATTTGAYASGRTDAAGNYTLYGLKSGAVYNMYVIVVSTTTQAQIQGQLNNVVAPVSGKDFTLSSPGIVRVSAVTSSSAPATVFGSVNLYVPNSNQNGWGNVRLLAGTTMSDNGDPFNPSPWTVIGLSTGTYTLHLNMQGYGTTDVSVPVLANSTTDFVLTLTPRASVYGKITLPTPAAVPVWVPVQGTLQGSNFPTVYGGASFNVGSSTAIFSLFAVSSGTYNITAQLTGYIPVSSTVVVGLSDQGNPVNGGVDFSTFTVGGHISGSITINGNTSLQTSPMILWINAFSAQLGQNAFTQVLLSTNTTSTTASYTLGGLANGSYQVNPPYLSGFSASPPGPQTVVVSSGSASLPIVMYENTGKITGGVTLPSGQSDFEKVHLSLQGPISLERDLVHTATFYSLDQLDTGYYKMVASYLTTGAQVIYNVAVTNGQTQTIPVDLSLSTFSVSGTVSIQSGFTMTTSSGATSTVNTISDLLTAATQQTLILGGVPFYTPTGTTCSSGTIVTTTTARVEAFPKDFNSYNQANRSGLTNCFGVNQYKYGTIAPNGSYVISGLTPGLWEIDVYPYFDGGNVPNVAVQKQVVSILGSNIPNTNFALAGGNSVSGTISLPSGITDVRTFNLQVQTDRGDTVQSTLLNIGVTGSPAPSSLFSFFHLANGNYSLVLQDPGTYDATLNRNVVRYVAKPVQFQITGGDLTDVNMTAATASRIVGKLAIQGTNSDGTSALVLITPSNAKLLSSNFNIQAQANPWVPSGFAQATYSSNGSGIAIDSNNQFSIDGLITGTYDVTFRQNTFGTSTQGSLDLADYTQGAVVVPQGQTLDLGTITLQPGLPLSGLVTDANGTPLSNIRVRANPSNSQHGNDGQEVFTNSEGKFSFTGLSPKVKVYDFVVAPRPSPNDRVQPVPFGEVKKRAVDVTQVPSPILNFALASATAGFSGTILTLDSGPLSFPDGDQNGWPAAAIYVNLQGNNNADNPLGDENATALDGTFNITNLPAGVYDITIESLGYRPLKLSGVTLTNTLKALGTLTLQKGPALVATLTKPDGSAVNTTDVRQAVAASADLSSIIFGQINSDAQTNNIISIKFGGFELSPKTYSILLFDTHDNIIVPVDGRGLVFTSNNDSVAKTLTFQPTAPVALANVQKSGSGSDVLVTFYLSRPLRNGLSDQDPSLWVTRSSGLGSLSNVILSGDRRQLNVTYTPAAGEQNATLQFSAHTVDVDASTGAEYVISKSVALLLGQKATAEQSINAAIGGNVSLSDALDASKVSIPANSLLNTTGSAADATSAYAFTLSATDDASSAGAAALAGAPRVAGMMARGPSAYLSESYAAMKAAKSQATVNPLSSFYSVLLPAGLSHSLNQTATVTLQYETGADPNLINVYYYNGSQYIIEQGLRTVDPVNHTISVGVSHFSTFVILENSQPVIQVNGGTANAADIEVFNFPNPFNLETKTKTLNHGGTSTTFTTEGTIIRYIVPAAKAGPGTVDIFNIVGEKVRSISLGAPATDTYNYVEWDGRNDSGKKVASGVYIGLLKVGSEKKFFKMAVIK